MNLNKKYLFNGFSLIELMVGTLLSSILLIGFTLLGSEIWGQLSYEDVHEKVQRYGNYVLDDMSQSFRKSDIDKIRIDSYTDGYSVVRVEFDNGNTDIKYSVDYMVSDPLHNISQHQINKNNEPIHRNNNTMNQYYNEFENKGYAVTISEFKCTELTNVGNNTQFGEENPTTRYGYRPFDTAAFELAMYIVDLQIEIYKKVGALMELYNRVDFQRTIFVSDEFI